MNDRIVVVGGGVIGLSIAYHLAKRGEDVMVIDGGRVGHGCSWGNAGWVIPRTTAPLPEPGIVRYALRTLGKPTSPVRLRPSLLVRQTPWLWRFARSSTAWKFAAGRHALVNLGRDTLERFDELRTDADFTVESRESLRAFDALDDARRSIDDSRRFLAGLGIHDDSELLDGSEAVQVEPVLSGKVGGAVVRRGELVVDPGSVTDALARAIRSHGGWVIEDAEVESLYLSGNRVLGALVNGELVSGSRFVVAAGLRTSELLRPLGIRVALQAGKGYSFAIKLGQQPSRMIDLAGAKCGIAPHGAGVRIVGVMDLLDRDTTIDRRRIEALLSAARPYVADWPTDVASADAVDEPWAGVRPMTADGLPIIDRLPTATNCYVATGHAMMGISLGLSTGLALAEFITEGKRPERLAPFALGR